MATHVFFLIRTSLRDCKKKMKNASKKKKAKAKEKLIEAEQVAQEGEV